MPSKKNKTSKKNLRRQLTLTGQGDYMTDIKDFISSGTPLTRAISSQAKPIIKNMVKQALLGAGSAAGGGFAGAVGIPVNVGMEAGRKLAARISKVIGSGDYTTSDKVACNSLFPASSVQTSAAASFGTAGTGVRIKHREYIEDIFTSTTNTFNVSSYPVQPGLSSTFQYLAQIASNFEEYYVHGMVFEFVSTTSPYFSGGAMGSVMMAMQYDAALPPFTSKPQLENSDYAISARPDVSMMYGIECKDQPMNGLYVRTSAITGSQPINFTDLGTLYVASQTPIASGVNLGELWVTYDIEFRRPHISPARFGYLHDTFICPNSGAPQLPQPITTVNYGGMLGRVVTATNVLNASSTMKYTFPNANLGDVYQVLLMGTVSTAASGVASVWNNLGGTGINYLSPYNNYTTNNLTSAQAPIVNSVVGTTIFLTAMFTIVSLPVGGPTFTVILPTFSTAAAGLNIDVQFIDVGNGFTSSTL